MDDSVVYGFLKKNYVIVNVVGNTRKIVMEIYKGSYADIISCHDVCGLVCMYVYERGEEM